MVSISSEKLTPDHILNMGAGADRRRDVEDQIDRPCVKGEWENRWTAVETDVQWSEILKGKANAHLFSYQNHLYDLMTRWHDPPNQLVKIQAHTPKKCKQMTPFCNSTKINVMLWLPGWEKSKTMVGHFDLAIGNSKKTQLWNDFSKPFLVCSYCATPQGDDFSKPFLVCSYWATPQGDCNWLSSLKHTQKC